MSKMVYITMQQDSDSPTGSGWPIKVYTTEKAAKAAVDEYRSAREETRSHRSDDEWYESTRYKEIIRPILYRSEEYYMEKELVE